MKDVNSFIEKLKILCGEDFESLNKMLGHTKKNTQSRTNQNFWHSIKFCVKADPIRQRVAWDLCTLVTGRYARGRVLVNRKPKADPYKICYGAELEHLCHLC